MTEELAGQRKNFFDGYNEGFRDARKWISVKEKLPDKTQGVLVWIHEYPSDYIEIAIFKDMRFTIDNVTHWMLLPDAPNENEEILKNYTFTD